MTGNLRQFQLPGNQSFSYFLHQESSYHPLRLILLTKCHSNNQQICYLLQWGGGKVIGIDWSASEELLCVQDDGTVSLYDMFGTFQNSFQMGQEAKEMKIIDVRTFATTSGTGLIVLTTNFRFFVVNNIKDPRIRRFPDIPGSQSISFALFSLQ